MVFIAHRSTCTFLARYTWKIAFPRPLLQMSYAHRSARIITQLLHPCSLLAQPHIAWYALIHPLIPSLQFTISVWDYDDGVLEDMSLSSRTSDSPWPWQLTFVSSTASLMLIRIVSEYQYHQYTTCRSHKGHEITYQYIQSQQHQSEFAAAS